MMGLLTALGPLLVQVGTWWFSRVNASTEAKKAWIDLVKALSANQDQPVRLRQKYEAQVKRLQEMP